MNDDMYFVFILIFKIINYILVIMYIVCRFVVQNSSLFVRQCARGLSVSNCDFKDSPSPGIAWRARDTLV